MGNIARCSSSIYSTDTYSFGYEFGEGCGIPGWGGSGQQVQHGLQPLYQFQRLQWSGGHCPFAFSADLYCTTDNNLTGVWVDNIDIAGVFTTVVRIPRVLNRNLLLHSEVIYGMWISLEYQVIPTPQMLL